MFGRTFVYRPGARRRHYDLYISDPYRPFFVDYVSTSPTDISPEGVMFIKEEESPNGKILLVVSHEISNTTTIFEITKN